MKELSILFCLSKQKFCLLSREDNCVILTFIVDQEVGLLCFFVNDMFFAKKYHTKPIVHPNIFVASMHD